LERTKANEAEKAGQQDNTGKEVKKRAAVIAGQNGGSYLTKGRVIE